MNITHIPDTQYGLYVWEMPDGRWIGDDEGNYLNIPSRYGDPKRVKALTDAVKHFGIEEGKPVFLPDRRRVTDSEYDDQHERLLDGKVPDWEDAANRTPGEV